jgi:RHS repeat-associated protein
LHVPGSQYIDEQVATWSADSGQWQYYLLGRQYDVIGRGNADGSVILPVDHASGGSPADNPLSRLDFNHDGFLDGQDVLHLRACMTGEDLGPPDQGCENADLDADGDVDEADFGQLQSCLAGSYMPVPPACASLSSFASGTPTMHGRPVDVIHDPTSGLDLILQDFRARTLHVKHARWLQQDPLGFVDGPNLYEAFGGNPLTNVDPFGRSGSCLPYSDTTPTWMWLADQIWQTIKSLPYLNRAHEDRLQRTGDAIAQVNLERRYGCDITFRGDLYIVVAELPARAVDARQRFIARWEGRSEPVLSQAEQDTVWLFYVTGINRMTDGLAGRDLASQRPYSTAEAVSEFSGGLSSYASTMATLGTVFPGRAPVPPPSTVLVVESEEGNLAATQARIVPLTAQESSQGAVVRTSTQNLAENGQTSLVRYIDSPGGLRRVAMQAHELAGDKIAVSQRAVAAVRVRLANGRVTFYAAGSGGRLTPAQRALLQRLGVPEENILHGAKYISGLPSLEKHAEKIILRNLPEGSIVTEWGISWAGAQKPIPCPNCAAAVENAGGFINIGH